MADWTIHHGDALDVLPRLTAGTIDCIVTSPPYAGQRAAEYGGIAPEEYPAWLADRLDAARPALTDSASVAIVIRPHIRKGRLSDYVLRTRLELRERGWVECDEWIWDKVSGPPTGPNSAPRRSWEHILWLAPSPKPWCDPLANGRDSERIGIDHGRMYVKGYGGHSVWGKIRSGRSRGIDIARFSTAHNTRGDAVDHPAPYPPALAAWIIRYLCPPEGTVCDPFAGSGSTGVAALGESRKFVGIDVHKEYVDMAEQRLAALSQHDSEVLDKLPTSMQASRS